MSARPEPGRRAVQFVHAAADEEARRILTDACGMSPLPIDELPSSSGACVALVTAERFLRPHLAQLEADGAAIVAISTDMFGEGRVDGRLYACLPADTPAAVIARILENAAAHLRLIEERRGLRDELARASGEIAELNRIGVALTAERDTQQLLDLIVTKAREITASDGGSLYVVEEEDADAPEWPPAAAVERAAPVVSARRLRFKIAQNDSVAFDFDESVLPLTSASIAGYVALTGDTINVADVYELPADLPHTFNRGFDAHAGYRTQSMLAVPMRTPQGRIVGVLQLVNAKRHAAARLRSAADVEREVRPYTPHQLELVASLTSQAAVALDNSHLYAEIQRLFEGFVRASVVAIEARDPATSGHSFRVANLTVAMAEVIDRLDAGPFGGVQFTRTQMKTIRYAALLHDFGKVGVREEVLVKAKKLYPEQLDLIRQRFKYAKKSREAMMLRARLNEALARGNEGPATRAAEYDAALGEEIAHLDEFLAAIVAANEPTVLAEGSFEKLVEIAAATYPDDDGTRQPLLTTDEVQLLSLRKGSLSEPERAQIESHVLHTYRFLSQIPWTREIRTIPAIAVGHHEKLNGMGYPYKLSAPDIPVETRIMTISDIFDALSAADRPYKKAVPIERALQILEFAVKDGELDPDLVRIFIEARVFDKWKVEPYPY